jgi:hypothetical protein
VIRDLEREDGVEAFAHRGGVHEVHRTHLGRPGRCKADAGSTGLGC